MQLRLNVLLKYIQQAALTMFGFATWVNVEWAPKKSCWYAKLGAYWANVVPGGGEGDDNNMQIKNIGGKENIRTLDRASENLKYCTPILQNANSFLWEAGDFQWENSTKGKTPVQIYS